MLNLIDDESSCRLYQTQQIRALEQAALTRGISALSLMETAGKAAFSFLRHVWPCARHIGVCCGRGNNAGDGYVLAACAARAGFTVTCYLLHSLSLLKPGPATAAMENCQQLGVTFQRYEPGVTLLESDVLVDALLGIGLSEEVEDPYKQFITAMNHSGLPILALDCPSGLDIDTGTEKGCAVKATATITFMVAKLGLFTHQGIHYSGQVVIDDLNLPADLLNAAKPVADLLDEKWISSSLPKRHRHAHKGNYGHVCVIGGDYGMGGAVRMAAEAALRVGAGLVSVATRPEHVSIVNATRPEIMCHEVSSAEDLRSLLARANAIVLGPGMGQTEWAHLLYQEVLQHDRPKVMDADSLNILSKSACRREDWVLTPHPGEAARLLERDCLAVQQNRLQAVNQLQQRYGGVSVLKGAGTLIKGSRDRAAVCPLGNPGMATAGMGDILSGVIGGLLAQGLSLMEAASVGVWIHARAADNAAEEGGERGLLATDLLTHLRELVNPC